MHITPSNMQKHYWNNRLSNAISLYQYYQNTDSPELELVMQTNHWQCNLWGFRVVSIIPLTYIDITIILTALTRQNTGVIHSYQQQKQIEDNSKIISTNKQGIVDMNRNGNFCKGTWVSKIVAEAKVDARVVQRKKSTSFCSMSVMENLLHFGCFALWISYKWVFLLP